MEIQVHALGYCAWHDSSISWRYFSVEICWGSARAYVSAKIAQYTETRATCIFLFFLLKFKKVNFKLCFDLVFWWYQLLLHRVFEFSNALTPEAISNPNVPSSSGSRDCRSPVESPERKTSDSIMGRLVGSRLYFEVFSFLITPTDSNMSHFPLTASISKVILAYMLQRLQVEVTRYWHNLTRLGKIHEVTRTQIGLRYVIESNLFHSLSDWKESIC